jgi:putative SOS response-associated peptidase YedK
MLNARAETLLEKPAYRGLLKRHRCLIVADGFYEWRVDADGKKQPVRFALANGEPFAFAGLWSTWHEPARDEDLVSCTIVTTRPNELLAAVRRCASASRTAFGPTSATNTPSSTVVTTSKTSVHDGEPIA